MRAVATSPAGSVGWPFGAPTQPSARTTQGSYFDKHGVLRFAPPGVLRPNYVYQNGVWVQDGWLREDAATNSVDATDFSNYNINDETCSPAWAGAGYSVTLQPKGVNGNPVIIWAMPSGGAASFFVWCEDISLLTISNFGSNAPVQYGKNLYRFYTDGSPRQPSFWNESTSGLYLEYGWFQAEAGSVPTSWIPYGQTRTAD